MAYFKLLSPSGSRAKLAVFIFHRVLPTLDAMRPDEPDTERFERIVRFIRRAYVPMTVSEASRKLADGTLPAAAACITFDDGYADNFTLAAPILAKLGVPATFFIATGYLDGGCMWNDRVIEALRNAPAGLFDLNTYGLGTHTLSSMQSRYDACSVILPKLKYFAADTRESVAREIGHLGGLDEAFSPMMTTEQLTALRQLGMEIGAHTVTHPILECVSDEQAQAEIRHSKAHLETLFGEKITAFAYPNGRPGKDYSLKHARMVQEAGFVAAVSTEQAIATGGSDLYQLPRFTPWDSKLSKFALRCGLALLQANGGNGAAS